VQISKWLQGKENVKVYFEDNNVVYDAWNDCFKASLL
jgi:hypothetical protein